MFQFFGSVGICGAMEIVGTTPRASSRADEHVRQPNRPSFELARLARLADDLQRYLEFKDGEQAAAAHALEQAQHELRAAQAECCRCLDQLRRVRSVFDADHCPAKARTSSQSRDDIRQATDRLFTAYKLGQAIVAVREIAVCRQRDTCRLLAGQIAQARQCQALLSKHLSNTDLKVIHREGR